MVRIAHVVPSLDIGGAEMALLRLVGSLDPDRFRSTVITLGEPGTLAPRFREYGIEVMSAGFGRGFRGFVGPLALRRLLSALGDCAPDIVHGWMYHGNLAAWAGQRLAAPRAALVWSIRQSLATIEHEPRPTRVVIRLGAYLSSRADQIVSNSRRAVGHHVAFGYDESHFVVIPNGFDTQRFQPDAQARRTVRAELKIPEDALVAGMIARMHPMKRHDLFLDALAELRRRGHRVHALLAGSGTDPRTSALVRQILERGLGDQIHLLGERRDVPRLMAALDVLVSASGWAEGFSNSIGESMACGLPCIVTDVGDSAEIVGETGIVVPTGDASALTEALAEFAILPKEERRSLGLRARARIETHYAQQRSTGTTAALYESLLMAHGAHP